MVVVDCCGDCGENCSKYCVLVCGVFGVAVAFVVAFGRAAKRAAGNCEPRRASGARRGTSGKRRTAALRSLGRFACSLPSLLFFSGCPSRAPRVAAAAATERRESAAAASEAGCIALTKGKRTQAAVKPPRLCYQSREARLGSHEVKQE